MNPFYGETRENLEKWLAGCRQELATGKIMTDWSASDASGRNQVIATLTVERRIQLILWELNRQFPDAYPDESVRVVRRTTPRYTW